MELRSLFLIACLLVSGIMTDASAQQFQRPGFGGPGRGGPGGPGFPGGPGHGGPGGPFPPPQDMENAFQIGQADFNPSVAFAVLNMNTQLLEIRLCAAGQDVNISQFQVLLGGGQILPLTGQVSLRRGDCLPWMVLPDNNRQLTQAMLVVQSGFRPTSVVLLGRQQRPQPKIWGPAPGLQNACGDGQGPFIKDGGNNQIPVMACPDQKPNGGPIGMSCEGLPRGTMCYGWRYQEQPGFFCSAPNGKFPPNPTYQYSVYSCN